jgi:hypothetical protein
MLFSLIANISCNCALKLPAQESLEPARHPTAFHAVNMNL